MNITAVYNHPDYGYKHEQTKVKEQLVLNQTYKLLNAKVGRWESTVTLEGIEGCFNSVHFDFFDVNGNQIDIIKIKSFSTYAYIRE